MRQSLRALHTYKFTTAISLDRLRIRVNCHSDRGVRVGWVIRETQCWNEYAFMDQTAFPVYYANPQEGLAFEGFNASASYLRFPESDQDCNGKITLPYQEVIRSLIELDSTFILNLKFSLEWT